MHDTIISGDGEPLWQGWLDSVAGRYLIDWERARIDALVGDVFGYYAVQLGSPTLDLLRSNRMPSRILATSGWPMPPLTAAEPDVASPPSAPGPSSIDAPAPAHSPSSPSPSPADTIAPAASIPSFTHRLVVDQFEDLPFAEQSVDLVVLPHVLERAADPHRVLREVDRVLRPEGRVIVSGMNPISLWGARHLLAHVGRPALPPVERFIGLPRLRDWFKLLSFDVDEHHYGCYRPPFRSSTWLDRMQFIERAGDRWWPICGAVYCVAAVKRVQAIRLIAPAWRKKEPKRRRVAVAASTNRQRQPVD